VRLLLDTHVWLWALGDPGRLAAKGRKLIESASNELWLSPVSVWEAALLVERGRVKADRPVGAWLEALLGQLPVCEAALTNAVAVASRLAVQVPHDDPADRFIAATAAVYELTLVTHDERLLAGKGYQHLAV
jgi:PIN domain nuclease of toxin-antitoxin system